jgi:hypothetical protein|tara:strand:+ start:3052 stop:3357 length:306 start_codon:yes stop_codon:yes gene_type:complete
MSVRITVKEINGRFDLYTDSGIGYEHPAGGRLKRGDPLPSNEWSYEHREDAEQAARELQQYLDDYEKRRKSGIRTNRNLEEQERKLQEHIHKHNVTTRKDK